MTKNERFQIGQLVEIVTSCDCRPPLVILAIVEKIHNDGYIDVTTVDDDYDYRVNQSNLRVHQEISNDKQST